MLSSAARHGYLKSSATVGLVLRAVSDRFSWNDYLSHLRDHVYNTYRIELPEDSNLVDTWRRSPHSLVDMLIDRLGQQTAVLSVYKALEDLINDTVISDHDKIPSLNGSLNGDRDKVPSLKEKRDDKVSSLNEVVVETTSETHQNITSSTEKENKEIKDTTGKTPMTHSSPPAEVGTEPSAKTKSAIVSPAAATDTEPKQTGSDSHSYSGNATPGVNEPKMEEIAFSTAASITASLALVNENIVLSENLAGCCQHPLQPPESPQIQEGEPAPSPDSQPPLLTTSSQVDPEIYYSDQEEEDEEEDEDSQPPADAADSDYHSGDGGQPSEGGPPERSPTPPPAPSPTHLQEEEEPLLPQESGDEGDPGHDSTSLQCPDDSDPGERQPELGDEHSSASGDGGASATPPESGPHLLKCVERQAMILTSALKEAFLGPDNGMPLTVEAIQRQLERFIFNPDPKVPREHQEPRYNFYPPFQIPKAIANYHIFAVTAPIPQSCKANRSGTELLQSLRTLSTLKRLPRWKYGTAINDSLGEEVAPITELQDVKLVPLRDDLSRLQWAKMRGDHIRYFCYPSLHMPPKITRMLMETLMQPFADESVRDDYPAPSISDEEIMCIVDPDSALSPPARAKAVETRRNMIALAVRYTTQLELMERVFREPSSIKKMQEVLHHTFHHGYVSLIRETAKVNLSNYSTFHGCTYNDPLNNCMIAKLMEGADKHDFLVDSIYLFLVITWQTAMGMWQQAIDDNTVKMYAEVFEKQRRALYALDTVTAISKAIVDILMDGDRLCHEMRKALPNFTTMSQINCFRQFVMERSNIPSVAAPFMPSDFVPLTYRQAQPLLWDQVYLLQLAFFLNNHGGYLWEPQDPEHSTARDKAYCPCNLCSPHRMPQHNVALHNEILAINTFEIRSAEGKTFKLTPELWTNAYLDKFVPEDYHPFEVRHFADNEAGFTKEMTACVTKSPEILSLIRQIQASREEFLLTRGKGVYKDPQTGEQLTPQPALHTGAKQLPALPASETDPARGTAAPAKPPRALRLAHAAVPTGETGDNGPAFGVPALPALNSSSKSAADHDGPEDGGREDPSLGTPTAPHGGSGLYYAAAGEQYRGLQPRGGDRFRRGNLRKRGHRFGDESDLRRGLGGPGGGGGRNSRGGRGRRGGGQREQSTAPYDPPQTQTPKYILPRAPLLGTPTPAENPARSSSDCCDCSGGGNSGSNSSSNCNDPSAP